MLGPNPRKAGSTPQSSSMEFPPKTAISLQTQSTEGGLMVKAMDEIFRHVEQADNPDAFKVVQICIHTHSNVPFNSVMNYGALDGMAREGMGCSRLSLSIQMVRSYCI